MALSVKQLLRRRGALVAAATSLGLLLALAARDVVLTLLGATDHLLPETGWEVALMILPFVLGVFACLWLLLPVAADLELRFVVTRAVGAALLGTVVQSIATVIVVLTVGHFWGIQEDSGWVAVTGQEYWVGFATGALRYAAILLVTLVPWVVLAAIFQWNWLKHHPAKFEVAGILDV